MMASNLSPKRLKLDTQRPATQADINELLAERVDLPAFAKRVMSQTAVQFALLSQDSRQFIFEMVQNVDDTAHTAHEARLTLALVEYDPRTKARLDAPVLLVLSQQDGFTRKDLEGICSMADGRNHDQFQGGAAQAGDHSTGEKGVGFKSVFSISTEPMLVTTHVDGGSTVSFSLPGSKTTLDQVASRSAAADETANTTIPYITPLPLSTDKLCLLESLLDAVNSVYSTGATISSGTVVALSVDRVPATSIRSMLTDEGGAGLLSELDLMFLRRIREVGLLVFSEHGQYSGRVFNYVHTPHDASTADLEVRTRTIGAGTLEKLRVTRWKSKQHEISLEHRVANRSRVVSLCRPLDEESFKCIHAQGTRVFSFLPTYNEPDAQVQFARQSFLINAHFSLTTARTAIDAKIDWNLRVLKYFSEEVLPAAFEEALRQRPVPWSDIYTLVPVVPGAYPELFQRHFQASIDILKSRPIIKVLSEIEPWALPSHCVMPPKKPMDHAVALLYSLESNVFAPPQSHQMLCQVSPDPLILASEASSEVIRLLGVRDWELGDFERTVIATNRECAVELWQTTSPEKWFRCLFDYSCGSQQKKLWSNAFMSAVAELFKLSLEFAPTCLLAVLDSITSSVVNTPGIDIDFSSICIIVLDFLDTKPESCHWWEAGESSTLSEGFEYLLRVLARSVTVLSKEDSKLVDRTSKLISQHIILVDANAHYRSGCLKLAWWRDLCNSVSKVKFETPNFPYSEVNEALLSILSAVAVEKWWERKAGHDIEGNLRRMTNLLNFVDSHFSVKHEFFADSRFLQRAFAALNPVDFWTDKAGQRTHIWLEVLFGEVLNTNKRMLLHRNAHRESSKVSPAAPVEIWTVSMIGFLFQGFPLENCDFYSILGKILDTLLRFGLFEDPQVRSVFAQLYLRGVELYPASFLDILRSVTASIIADIAHVRPRQVFDCSEIFEMSLGFLESGQPCWQWWVGEDRDTRLKDILKSFIGALNVMVTGHGDNDDARNELCLRFTAIFKQGITNMGGSSLCQSAGIKEWHSICMAIFESVENIAVKNVFHRELFSPLLSLFHTIPADSWWNTGTVNNGLDRLECILEAIENIQVTIKPLSNAAADFFLDATFFEEIFKPLESSDFWGEQSDEQGHSAANQLEKLLNVLNVDKQILSFGRIDLNADSKVRSWLNALLVQLITEAPKEKWWADKRALQFDGIFQVLSKHKLLGLLKETSAKKIIPLLGSCESPPSVHWMDHSDEPVFLALDAKPSELVELLTPPVIQIVHSELLSFGQPYREVHISCGVEQLSRECMMEKVAAIMRTSKERLCAAERKAAAERDAAVRDAQETTEKMQVMSLNLDQSRARQERSAQEKEQLHTANDVLIEENARLRDRLALRGEVVAPLPAAIVQPHFQQPQGLNFGAWLGNQPGLQAVVMAAANPLPAALGRPQATAEQQLAHAQATTEAMLRSSAIRRLRTRTTLGIVSREAGTINLGFTTGVSDLDVLITSFL